MLEKDYIQTYILANFEGFVESPNLSSRAKRGSPSRDHYVGFLIVEIPCRKLLGMTNDKGVFRTFYAAVKFGPK